MTRDQEPAQRSRLGGSFVMFTALKYPQYRRYWLSNLSAVSAQQMMWVAQGWLVYDMTKSPLALGFAGLMTAAPALLLNLVGGVLADRVDQRKVIMTTQAVISLAVAVLASLTALGLVEVWHVLTVSFISGATQAFNNPARQSIFPQLVERKDLMHAVSLNSLVWQGTRIVAPAFSGIVYALAGAAVTFYICSAGFLVLGIVVAGLNVSQRQRETKASMLGDLTEGIGFIRANFIFMFLIGMSFFSSFFGMSAQQLMPVFARDILDAGPSGLGFLLSMSGIGAVSGVVILGFFSNFDRKGVLIVGGATAYGAALILFALSSVFTVSAIVLLFMGAAATMYQITLQTALQLRVPDQLRGRVMGVYGMTHNLGPLGALQAGIIADYFGAPVAVALSGSLIIAFALGVALSRSEVRSLQAAQSQAA